MELWYPPASRSALAPVDAGSFTGGGRKGLFHTTEGVTAASAIASYRSSGSWPHFTASYEGGTFRIWQHIPIDRAARSLVHLAGHVETNRNNVIQIELVGSAAQPPSDPGYLAGIATWMQWVEANFGVPHRCTVTFKPYPASYGANNGVRLSEPAWNAYAGWLGHEHAPENLHGDPGALNIQALLQEDEDVPYTSQQLIEFAYEGAKKALNEGTAFGTRSWAETARGTLANIQAVANQLNGLKADLGSDTNAILAAIAALPTPPMPQAQKEQVADALVKDIPGLDRDKVIQALDMNLAGAPAAADARGADTGSPLP